MSYVRLAAQSFALVCAAGLASCSSGRATTSDRAYSVEPIALETPTGALHGTLVLPSNDEPHPSVLIIAGSGPTDRDGNSSVLGGANNSLRLLAEGLARRGIASIRYDKRGVAQSASAAPSEDELRFDTYVDDAVAWLEKLREDNRFESIAVVGHSEGSLVGILATARTNSPTLVSVAGVARRGSDVLRDQLRNELSADLWSESERILAALEAGALVDDVPSELFALFRPSVQPYLISWFRYVPAEELTRLDARVLIAQGTTDIQVAVSEAEALHAAKPDAELLILDGMNHVLKQVPADPDKQRTSYSDPSLPINEELLNAVGSFL